MLDVTVTFDTRALERELTRVQRRVLPRAASLALNRSATKVRQAVVREVSRLEKRKGKVIRQEVAVARRARPDSLLAVVRAQQSSHLVEVPLSKPFQVPIRGRERWMRRAEVTPPGYRGRGRTLDRPPTSSQNLPIYPGNRSVKKTRIPRAPILRQAARAVMATFMPAELERQIARLAARR